jgi:DNA/RNA-binding domain of Phe-tRNA-synthetase-like protein
MKSMIVQLEDGFLDQYPDSSIHALVADNVTRVNDAVVAQWRQNAASAVAKWNIDPQRLVEETWIGEWRNAMKKMGVNAAKTRSSIEQLAKRALGGAFIATPIPAVNLYCAISTIARAPMGGYRIASLNGDVTVQLARGSEMFLGIGEKVPMQVAPGVVIYADKDKVACYAWNHKDSAQTCLTPSTDKAIFFADAVSVEGRCRAAEALQLLSEALLSCGCRIRFTGALDGSAPALTVPLDEDVVRDNEWDEVIHSS